MKTKFSEMKYERPDLDEVKAKYKDLTSRLSAACDYDEAKAVFLEKEAFERVLNSAGTICHIRNSINTKDEFYDAEMKFWNSAIPELEEYSHEWTLTMLKSPHRADFEREFGDLMFINAEIELKTFSPEIIPQLKEENDLSQEYENLLAASSIPYEGKEYTISQIQPFKSQPDDERRLAAWRAEGKWFKDNRAKLDELYDRLTHLRDKMGRALGYDGYTKLGY
ncbi:MAG: M3 family oligoendopeptidase, partial [Clostridia bacterium]|nr:M3 family oligoendopeptidase [Clostridia bacterium]